jgi:hypothetical protein
VAHHIQQGADWAVYFNVSAWLHVGELLHILDTLFQVGCRAKYPHKIEKEQNYELYSFVIRIRGSAGN